MTTSSARSTLAVPQARALPTRTSPATPAPRPAGGRAVAPGTRVPLAMLPVLPMRTAMNTMSVQRRRPMAADGSTITLTAGAGCTATAGTLYNVNCAVTYVASGTPSTTDQYQYYYVPPGAGTGTAAGTYTGTPTTQGPLTLSIAGLWTFGVYDVTKGLWETVIYVNVGSATTVKTYQDAYYSAETYQFTVGSSTNVYIQVAGVSSADQYVTYMETTSVNPRCVYMAPSPGKVSSLGLCNPTTVATGQSAVGGMLDVNWPIDASYAGGTYSIVVYDKTIGTRLGQTQVSFTPVSGITMRMMPDGTNANPSPRPIPAATPGTIFAWDGANDQSTSGVQLTTAGLATSPMWAISDPTGRVVGQQNSGTNYTFNFNPTVLAPGGYAPKVFTATLYDGASNSVIASQSFQLLGYYVGTFFNTGSGRTTGIPVSWQQNNVSSQLIFENDSALNYGASNGDGFRAIEFTTGSDFTATDGPGSGVYAYISGTACAAGCTQTATATDTAGNLWNVTDTCPLSGLNVPPYDGECTILLTPQSTSVVLAPGASITLNNVLFTHDLFSNCANYFGATGCPGATSVLPQHGLTWSSINTSTAGNYVTFTQPNGNQTEAATASVSLAGAITGAGTFKTPQVDAHLYTAYSTQVAYARTSPYTIGSNAFDIYKVTINNTSSNGNNNYIQTVAIGLPGSYGTTSATSNNFRQDTAYGWPTGWVLQVPCATTSSSASQGQYICIDGTASGQTIRPGASQTFYIDANPPSTSFGMTEWQVAALSPYAFLAGPSATNLTIPVGGTAPVTVDSLAFGMYSLDETLMAATLSPSSAGQGTSPTETVTFTNTTAGADPNPDYVDNVLIAAPNSLSLSSAPTTSTTGWSYLGSVTSGSTTYWWFSACNNGQATTANLPPLLTPLTAVPTQLTACTAAQLTRALAPGQSLVMSFGLQNLNSSGTTNFNYYAHGANGGGWTQPGTFGLTVSPVSANAGFTAAGGYPTATTVTTGTTPTIGGNASSTNGNAYTYAIKNTSATGAQNNISYMRIVIPGTDTSGANATDSNGQTWQITGTGATLPTVVGSTDGCTVTAYQSAGTSGANGFIDIGKTTASACALKPGDTLTVAFQALAPSAQNDTYQFPTINMNNAGVNAGENWQYDTYVKESLTVGLSVVVNPTNPGPGNSAPNPTCPAAYPCAFSGTTINFGQVPNSTTNPYTDVVRASVYINSGGTVNWNLYVDTTNNPPRTGAGATNELLTDVDTAASTQNPTHITFDQTTYGVVPTTGPGLELANGTNVPSSTLPLDIIQNFELSIGTEPITGEISTVTYTLVAN